MSGVSNEDVGRGEFKLRHYPILSVIDTERVGIAIVARIPADKVLVGQPPTLFRRQGSIRGKRSCF